MHSYFAVCQACVLSTLWHRAKRQADWSGVVVLLLPEYQSLLNACVSLVNEYQAHSMLP